jgi:hypothetical protein
MLGSGAHDSKAWTSKSNRKEKWLDRGRKLTNFVKKARLICRFLSLQLSIWRTRFTRKWRLVHRLFSKGYGIFVAISQAEIQQGEDRHANGKNHRITARLESSW